MQRVNQYIFYNLGGALSKLRVLQQGDSKEKFMELIFCDYLLDQLQRNDPIPLGLTKSVCGDLSAAIGSALAIVQPKDKEEDVGSLDSSHVTKIRNALQRFETILSAELQSVDVYFVSQKGIYSTPDLIEHAENILSDDIRKDVPATVLTDLREAGRCLAFDVPTAAGFHILRAVEAVIRQYYQVVVGSIPKTTMRNWGAYIRILRTKGADEKVIASLDQIRELHRNPVMHPEETLSSDEATTLFGIAQSAILAMVNAIPRHRQQTLANFSMGLERKEQN